MSQQDDLESVSQHIVDEGGAKLCSLSAQARTLWAKTGQGEQGHLWSPLYIHLLDSLYVAGHLWDEWLPRTARARVAQGLGGSEGAARALACLLAGVHDIGKATPAFQCKVPERAEVVMSSGLAVCVAPGGPAFPHASMGELVLRRWLAESRNWRDGRNPSRTAAALSSVVGAHHGATSDERGLRSIAEHQRTEPNETMGDSSWQAVQDELLAVAWDVSHAEACEDVLENARLDTCSLVLLNGLVIMADWIASNADLFPLTDRVGDLDAFEARARVGWGELALPGPWRPEAACLSSLDEQLFHARFPDLPSSFSLRPAQAVALGAARAMPAPGLLIIEAPMGSGKTEASLLCAETLAARCSEGGLAYLLPTMATSNAMFTRVKRWLESVPDERGASRRSMQLLHSKAELNADFERLRDWDASWMGDSPGDAGSVVAHQWFGGRKRGLLASFVVGTVDQALMAALKTRHVQLRQLGLAGKAIVIDEIHAYDAYMNVYLDRALDYLGAYGVPVILLSATLPPSRRAELIRAYRGLDDPGAAAAALDGGPGGAPSRMPSRASRRKRQSEFPPAPRRDDGGPAYPLITSAGRDPDGPVVYAQCQEASASTEVEASFLPDDGEALLSTLSELLSEGGCACVLRDTVTRAQRTYSLLRERLGFDAMLVHSRFIGTDRAANDRRLLRLVGPDSDERPERLVVVGTQVLEQSLDIDFDVMVSDIAPIDLLLQRVGRLHRHRRGEGEAQRPAKLRQARLLVTGLDDMLSEPPKLARGISNVYQPVIIWRSVLAIQKRMGGNHGEEGLARLRLPQDIAPLVEEVYESLDQAPEMWEPEFSEADDAFKSERASKVARADEWLLGKPQNATRNASLDGWLTRRFPDDMADIRARAAVRDSQESIEVVVVQDKGGMLYTLPSASPDENGKPLPPQPLGSGRDVPDDKAARLAALCSVNLPPALTIPSRADGVIKALEKQRDFSGWQASRWLRGALPLVLDADGQAEILIEGERVVLQYNRESGLTYIIELN